MTWIIFLKKLNSPLLNENNEVLKRILLVYLNERGDLHRNFLTVLFNCIDILELSEIDFKSVLKPEEVSQISTEWSDFLSKESLFKLLIQALYLFSTRFPTYLR